MAYDDELLNLNQAYEMMYTAHNVLRTRITPYYKTDMVLEELESAIVNLEAYIQEIKKPIGSRSMDMKIESWLKNHACEPSGCSVDEEEN